MVKSRNPFGDPPGRVLRMPLEDGGGSGVAFGSRALARGSTRMRDLFRRLFGKNTQEPLPSGTPTGKVLPRGRDLGDSGFIFNPNREFAERVKERDALKRERLVGTRGLDMNILSGPKEKPFVGRGEEAPPPKPREPEPAVTSPIRLEGIRARKGIEKEMAKRETERVAHNRTTFPRVFESSEVKATRDAAARRLLAEITGPREIGISNRKEVAAQQQAFASGIKPMLPPSQQGGLVQEPIEFTGIDPREFRAVMMTDASTGKVEVEIQVGPPPRAPGRVYILPSREMGWRFLRRLALEGLRGNPERLIGQANKVWSELTRDQGTPQ